MKIISRVCIFLICLILLLAGSVFFEKNGQADKEVIKDLENGDNIIDKNENDNIDVDKGDNNTNDNDAQENGIVDTENNEENDDPKESIDLSLEPNETGQVMILMYHNIGYKESAWVRTPENFRRDLETLYNKGYRVISLKDFVNNNIKTEAGYTPVVITFDDGNQNNFNIIEKDGQKIIDPNCAVGIMEDFKREHSDFNITATFFVYGTNPFKQSNLIEYKLKWLIENGYDVGNHTLGHNDMSKVNDAIKIQKYIGKQAAFIESFLDEYNVETYALAYGARPKKEYQHFLVEGEYEGERYKNVAVLNVGWDPSVSPIDKKFNPFVIHRVRASATNVDNVGMYNWLSMFDKYPERKYISDGNPNIITVPKKYEDKIDKDRIIDKEIYVYEN